MRWRDGVDRLRRGYRTIIDKRQLIEKDSVDSTTAVTQFSVFQATTTITGDPTYSWQMIENGQPQGVKIAVAFVGMRADFLATREQYSRDTRDSKDHVPRVLG